MGKSFTFYGCIVVGLLIWLWSPSVEAAVVLLKDQSEPEMGFLLEQDGRQVVLGQPQGEGELRRIAIDRDDIEEIWKTVSTERLEALAPEKPEEYLLYAEELAAKSRDPEARAAAIRLYLIAAHLAPEELSPSAMLGLIDLARSRAEEKRFRALAYLLDPRHRRELLSPPAALSLGEETIAEADRARLLHTLRMLRYGERERAKRAAETPEVRRLLQHPRSPVSYEEFLQACDDPSRLTPQLLRKILQLELMLLPSSASARAGDAAPWSEQLRAGEPAPLRPLELESVTEFDPRHSIFQNGEWVTPENAAEDGP